MDRNIPETKKEIYNRVVHILNCTVRSDHVMKRNNALIKQIVDKLIAEYILTHKISDINELDPIIEYRVTYDPASKKIQFK